MSTNQIEKIACPYIADMRMPCAYSGQSVAIHFDFNPIGLIPTRNHKGTDGTNSTPLPHKGTKPVLSLPMERGTVKQMA